MTSDTTDPTSELRSSVVRLVDDFIDAGAEDERNDGWYIYTDKKLDQLMQLISNYSNKAVAEANRHIDRERRVYYKKGYDACFDQQTGAGEEKE